MEGRKQMPCRKCVNCLTEKCLTCKTCLNKKLGKKCEQKGNCLTPKLSKIKISKCWRLEEVENKKKYPLQNEIEEIEVQKGGKIIRRKKPNIKYPEKTA